MKKLLLVVMLVGFGMSGIAQNKVKCKMTSTKKSVKTHHVAIKKQAPAPVYTAIRSATIPEPCTSYRKHNIVVTECPGLMFDQSDRLEASSYRNYSGYLPLNAETVNLPAKDSAYINPSIAPQHNVIENNHIIAPTSGNFCTNCSAQ